MEPWGHVYYPWFSSGMVVAVVVLHTHGGSINCTLSRSHLCPMPVWGFKDPWHWFPLVTIPQAVFLLNVSILLSYDTEKYKQNQSVLQNSLLDATYSYKPLIRNHFSKINDHRVVMFHSVCFCFFQGRITFADLLAVEGMKSLIMWSCSFRWVLCFSSLPCPMEMASQGKIYSERIRPRLV